MGEFAKALATEEEITIKGKVYKKAAMITDVIAEFETFLENRAFDSLERQRLRMAPADYSARFADLCKASASGEFGFLSETGQKSYQNSTTDPANAAGIELLYLRLKYGNPGNPDITRELAREHIENNFEEILKQFARETTPDPNSLAPETPGAAECESKPSSPV